MCPGPWGKGIWWVRFTYTVVGRTIPASKSRRAASTKRSLCKSGSTPASTSPGWAQFPRKTGATGMVAPFGPPLSAAYSASLLT